MQQSARTIKLLERHLIIVFYWKKKHRLLKWGETTYDCPRKARANKKTTCSVCRSLCNCFFLFVGFLRNSLRNLSLACVSGFLSLWLPSSCDFEFVSRVCSVQAFLLPSHINYARSFRLMFVAEISRISFRNCFWFLSDFNDSSCDLRKRLLACSTFLLCGWLALEIRKRRKEK